MLHANTSTSSNRQTPCRLHDSGSHSIDRDQFSSSHNIFAYTHVLASTLSPTDLALHPMVSSHQDAVSISSELERRCIDKDAKEKDSSSTLNTSLHAASAYLSIYDSTLLRCYDEAEVELKTQLWPLVTSKMKIALCLPDELDADLLE